MEIEAVLLTGGASRRMGRDKAQLRVLGKSLAELVAEQLLCVCCRVTVLGSHPVSGCELQRDEQPFSGPRAALARFEPHAKFVFVASCDMPLFRSDVVLALASSLGEADAAVPKLGGYLQPTCAMYRASALSKLAAEKGDSRLMKWLDLLDVVELDENCLCGLGLQCNWMKGANTEEELQLLIGSNPSF